MLPEVLLHPAETVGWWYRYRCDLQAASVSVLYLQSTCRVAQKFGTIFMYALTLPNIHRSSKLFHCQNQEKLCNNTITKDPAAPQVCRYSTSWNGKCLKNNNFCTPKLHQIL